MPNDNPLNDGSFSPEPTLGESYTNLTTRRRVNIGGQDLILSEQSTQRVGNGIFEDTQTEYVHTDRAGNPLPENPTQTIVSHSGILTTSENTALCDSWLHWGQRSRTIALGHDGFLTPNGAICSHCNRWRLTLSLTVLIVTAGGFIGLIIGILNY